VSVVLLIVLALVILGLSLYFLRPGWFGDDSIVIDERRETNGGYIVEGGRIYSQARVVVPPGVELVLPVTRNRPPDLREVTPMIEVQVRVGDEPDVVSVLTETKIALGGHFRKTIRLSDHGRGTRIVKRQVGSVLTIDVDPGHSHWENFTGVKAIFVVPPDRKVRQEPPTAAEYANRYKADPIFWIVPDEEQKAAGWEEVPLSPLSHRKFR
jgi:hypothetical protein